MTRLDFADNSTTLMPNAVTVAELQHICDNAQSLVHTELEHWAVLLARDQKLGSAAWLS
jgi:hypothetical protein